MKLVTDVPALRRRVGQVGRVVTQLENGHPVVRAESRYWVQFADGAAFAFYASELKEAPHGKDSSAQGTSDGA